MNAHQQELVQYLIATVQTAMSALGYTGEVVKRLVQQEPFEGTWDRDEVIETLDRMTDDFVELLDGDQLVGLMAAAGLDPADVREVQRQAHSSMPLREPHFPKDHGEGGDR